MPSEETHLSTQYNTMAATFSALAIDHNKSSNADYFECFPLDLTGKSVLDLGCGNGDDLGLFRSRGAEVFGIDASSEMVRISKERNPYFDIKVGTFTDIPFANQSFDFVVSKWAIQTAAMIDPIYHEVARVLKPGGKFIFLACHPMRQFMEKKRFGKDYFTKEDVVSVFFDGQVTAIEPSHTLQEFLSPLFFRRFSLYAYREGYCASAEKVNGDVYPSYLVLSATRCA